MRRSCLLLLACLPLVAIDSATQEQPQPFPVSLAATYAAVATGAAYAAATAHAPRFTERAIWPGLTGKERFQAAKWPAARLLVWDPAKRTWTENGKPTGDTPDHETDAVLPDADFRYDYPPEGPASLAFRHLTIGRNAALCGGGDGQRRVIAGNLWIKRGGACRGQGMLGFVGGRDAFARIDNPEGFVLSEDQWRPLCHSQYLMFDKPKASLEVLGLLLSMDEFMVEHGTLIIGPDSLVLAGRNAEPRVAASATLAILDGGRFGKWTNERHGSTDLFLRGAVVGGLPERPLTRNAHLGLSARNWNKGALASPRSVSLVAEPGAVLASHPAPGSKARLVVGWGGRERFNEFDDLLSMCWQNVHKDDAQRAAMQREPRGLGVFLPAGVQVRDVVFAHVAPGGLLTTAKPPATWKMSFDASCPGQGERVAVVGGLGPDYTW